MMSAAICVLYCPSKAIEKGNRYPPDKDKLYELARILCLSEEETNMILFVMQIYSPMTSNIILAPSLNPFLKIKQSVLV